MDQFALGIASVTVGFALSDYAKARGKRVEAFLHFACFVTCLGVLAYCAIRNV